MKARRSVHEDRDEAIFVALKRGKKPLSADDLYKIIQPFFSHRNQFSGTMGGLVKTRKVAVDNVGETKFYSLLADEVGKSVPQGPRETPVVRIDEIYTRKAQAMVLAIREKNVKPSASNNPDKVKPKPKQRASIARRPG